MVLSKSVAAGLERASWIRRMFEAANRLRAERGPDAVADLSLGNPCNDPPKEFYDVLRAEAEGGPDRPHRYMSNPGYPDVREAVATHLKARSGVGYEGCDICMTTGAAGGLNVLLRSLLDPGDDVVLTSPLFVEYPFYVENFGGQVCVVPSGPDFLPDVERIADACTATTKAVILNSPNNPTGRIYPEQTYRDLGRALAARSAQFSRPIYLIFDDPYYELYYTGRPPPEPAQFYDQVLYVSSFSKDLGLAGERIGYIAIHPDAVGRADLASAFAFSLRALGQVNAPALLQRATKELIGLSREHLRDFFRTRRDRTARALEKGGFETSPLEGAFYAFPKSPDADDLVFCRRMLDKGLVIVPGAAFGAPGYFRISYAVDDEILDRGLAILTAES